MAVPRLEINLEKIQYNASTLTSRLRGFGIDVTGVTKGTLGSPEIASAFVRGGVSSLGDSHIENIERMKQAGVNTTMTLLRSPMLSQIVKVIKLTDYSYNSELEVIREISTLALRTGRKHGIVLMVELGDLREGIMPKDLVKSAKSFHEFKNIYLKGIGTNLACRSGIEPDAANMAQLSALANKLEAELGITLEIVSGGNSANLDWVTSGRDRGRVNHLRLGESILLGVESLNRNPIEGLHTDAFTLVAEVIESKTKPTLATGTVAQNAFGTNEKSADTGLIGQAIVAIGRQEVDPDGILPPPGVEVLAASSDHLIVKSNSKVGSEIRFGLNYSAMLRAMTSPFVTRVYSGAQAMAATVAI